MGERLSVMALLFLMMPVGALAEGPEAASQGFTRYERYSVHYDVNPDGTHVETHDVALKVLERPGLSHANKAAVSFSERLQEAEILAAYTAKSDGRRIDSPPSNYQNASNTGEGTAAPMFSDIATRWVVFPDVAVGDTVVFSYRVTQKEPLFPGNFSMAHSFPKFQAYENAAVTLTAPKDLYLGVYARGVEGGEIGDDENRRRWKWTFRNRETVLPESGSVSPLDHGPLIVASTFRDYGQLAAAYNERAEPKAAVTERIRTLSDELTSSTSEPRARAELLYDWVRKNIKFAGNCVGNGGVVPRDAESVLANRMGDCKDHSALLQALLAAQGIESSPVLINSGSAYALPEVPVIEAFNHVMTYIPSLDLYADSTAEDVAFGTLPHLAYDKPVVHTAGVQAKRRTPAADYRNNRARTVTVLTILEDGSADGESRIELEGTFAGGYRSWMEHVQPQMEDQVVRGILSKGGHTGTGVLLRDEISGANQPFTYGGRYHIDHLINVDGPGAVLVKTPFAPGYTIETFATVANEPPRTVNYSCGGGTAVEELTIVLPPNVQLLAVPRDAALSGPRHAYSSRYRADGNTVTVVRRIEDRTDRGVCTPEDQANEKPFAAAVLKDLRSQVVYMDNRQQASR